MRKLIAGLSVAAVTAAAVMLPTMASAELAPGRDRGAYPAAVPVAGVLVGTAVGVGLYHGWYGAAPAIGSATLPTTAAGAATIGGIAGVGTVALIDAALQPCKGFHALFGANKNECANGEYVGYQQRPARGARYYR